ncbi:unnamed protein product (macronuclear) [Paramecium tetraurelia]|uniref:RING-type domain-containing protein n=1 Tax=Paramecium tetraurelia TaxID=5888 RepID=A0E6W4_PARTE|nr:uncharacterized protein GSPATT00023759001 [Paramecium tetraurelia]CAK91031.1 unnamed protein product [Paramecium tetraurelia]|eukprot:XP_001458428.1 hypothetical protein (macronuclear) [Paramecium tetraurelia strain d4-2]
MYLKQFRRNQPVNNIFRMIKNLDVNQRGLKYFDNMTITGYPIKRIQTLKSKFDMIDFKSKIIDNLEVQISVPNNIYIKEGYEIVSYPRRIILSNEEFFLVGDFIYNSQTQILRCNKIKALQEMKNIDLNQIFKRFYTKHVLKLLLKIGIIALCLCMMYKFAKRMLIFENGQVNQILISNQHRQLKCKICKNRNSNIIVLPCQHLVGCQECYSRRYFCPICRSYIQSRQKIFND